MGESSRRASRTNTLTNTDAEPLLLRRLVLVGAGRVHLHVVRSFTKRLVRGLEIVLVTPDREEYNGSMTSGLLRGAYTLEQLRIDVDAIAKRAGARLVYARAERIALDERVVVAGSERIPFDVCSLDVVGMARDASLPGVEEYTIPLRPSSRLTSARDAIRARMDYEPERPLACVVVGGGVTGVEAAFVLLQMLRERKGPGVLTIVDMASTILPAAEQCRPMVREALERVGVCFALGARAIEVRSDGVVLASGGMLPADLVIWATGGAPASVTAASRLPSDEHGYLLVDEHLRAIDGSAVWGAGDCVRGDGSASKAGRQAETLSRELRHVLDVGPAGSESAQARERCLIDTADGRAIARWGAFRGRWRFAGWVRRRRDARYVAKLART